MQDQTFVNAVFARPPRVLRKRLRPFCVGHWFLLCVLESPFAYRDAPALVSDLALAVAICSRPYPAALRMLRTTRRCRWSEYFRGIRCRRLDMAAEAEAMREYIAAYTRFPDCWGDADGKSGKGVVLPAPLHIAWTLAERMPIEQAWETPAIDAMMLCAAQAERNGTRFVSDSERTERARLQLLREELANAG